MTVSVHDISTALWLSVRALCVFLNASSRLCFRFSVRAIDVLCGTVLQVVETLWDEVRNVQDNHGLRDENEHHQQVDPVVPSKVTTHNVTVRTFVTACVDEVCTPEVTMQRVNISHSVILW